MQAKAIAIRYLELFCSGRVDELEPLLAPNLRFEGPFHRSETASDYLDALRKSPPKDCRFELLQSFEDQARTCLLFRFEKPEISVLMAQFFEVADGRITSMQLVFDGRPF